ncbi:uncharacterized protein JCM10292_004914 [Rhodotorula paludigena]|uniref:uncharacterized protein n=1 Tax=Rhodotorula paludigena TaxID=86838 RepID=UPI00317E9F39
MATTPPQTRSRSGSIGLGRPTTQPIAIPAGPAPAGAGAARSTGPTSPPVASPSSALSQSLKAFADLHLADKPAPGNPLDSQEFREAFDHARRASFGNLAHQRPQLATPSTESAVPPPLSHSPSASSDAGTSAGSLPTPPSSSPPTSALLVNPPALPAGGKPRTMSNGANGKVGRAPSSTLGGVCERPELDLERGDSALDDSDLVSPVASAAHGSTVTPPSGSIFANGARWGWPGSSTATRAPAEHHARSGSLTFVGSPPAHASTSVSSGSSGATAIVTSPPVASAAAADPFRMMQPLGRVVSAGAALQTPQGKTAAATSAGGAGASEGFGLFRRFSISGLGGRKTRAAAPPSPPLAAGHSSISSSGFSSQPAPTLLEPAHSSLPPPVAVDATATTATQGRGRTLSPTTTAGGAKSVPKRRISPMGEKILRGGY